MSAAVCGSKRPFFEELPPSPPVSKRLRCSSSSSPIRFSAPSLLDQLRSVFPDMELHILERALQECGNDLDAAIQRLHELCLRSAEDNSGCAEESDAIVEKAAWKFDALTNDGNDVTPDHWWAPKNLPMEGAEWVDLFVREMMCATSMDDAKARATRLLGNLEKSISSSAGEATETLCKENVMLKEQIEGLMRENTILKRAVAIQHERQKEYENVNGELHHFKQLVSQYQEQLRTLEMNNYTLSMHLKQANRSSSIPGRFHPDVF